MLSYQQGVWWLYPRLGLHQCQPHVEGGDFFNKEIPIRYHLISTCKSIKNLLTLLEHLFNKAGYLKNNGRYHCCILFENCCSGKHFLITHPPFLYTQKCKGKSFLHTIPIRCMSVYESVFRWVWLDFANLFCQKPDVVQSKFYFSIRNKSRGTRKLHRQPWRRWLGLLS